MSEEEAMERFKASLGRFSVDEDRKRGLGLVPKPGDVFICTPPKCGTTWLQQIVHQLRTGGSMDFEEISCEIPWLETTHSIGVDSEKEQPSPRAFKTHVWLHHLNYSDDAKYILVYREPADTAISFYNFMSGWFFEQGSITPDTFVREFFLKRGKPASIMHNPSYWENLISWWPHAKSPNFLWLFYEDMLADHRGTVERVASFLGYDPEGKDASLVDVATKHSTFEFMKQHRQKFDEHVWKQLRNATCGLPADAGAESAKVMTGGSRHGKAQLCDENLAMLEEQWAKVREVTGHATYDDLRASFPK